jgi:hypothetical protein
VRPDHNQAASRDTLFVQVLRWKAALDQGEK